MPYKNKEDDRAHSRKYYKAHRKEILWDISNGVTLCKQCHRLTFT